MLPSSKHCWIFHLPLKHAAAAAAKSLQSCPTLCDPIDGSLPGSAIPGILQARTVEWVAISFSNAWSEERKWSRSVVSNSWQLHGLQPTRVLHPLDFPGKSTGVGCHCLLRRMEQTWRKHRGRKLGGSKRQKWGELLPDDFLVPSILLSVPVGSGFNEFCLCSSNVNNPLLSWIEHISALCCRIALYLEQTSSEQLLL